jgi:hypothetical protein
MMIRWIDKRSHLKSGKEYYKAGDTIPAGILSKNRIKLFQSLNQLEIVDKIVQEPENKTDKKKADAKKTGGKKTDKKKTDDFNTDKYGTFENEKSEVTDGHSAEE